MVITVTCPSCSSSFPVDPTKVPAGGVNARCSMCGHVFRVEKPADSVAAPAAPAAATPPPAMPPTPPPPAVPPAVEPGGFAAAPAAPPPPAPMPPPPAQAAAAPAATAPAPAAAPAPPPPAPEPAAAAASSTGTFRFGKRDPTDKAKRLARVLVSDMIMYNAERHRTALENGTLTQDFEEEIDKSWKEFVDQVGPELAEGEGRRYWREALNDILAKG
ncbi:MAG TPA: zinc-ribbon domain-containing protein, partial [Longimicrobiales bacterium]|nr:zinc-ribbon domain-containing protein [Longimicrobiales bacterium]